MSDSRVSEPFGYVREALMEHFGKRCDTYDKGCPVCDAWREYDNLIAAPEPQADCAVCGDRVPVSQIERGACMECNLGSPEPQADPATSGEVERIAARMDELALEVDFTAEQTPLTKAAALLRQQAQRIAELEAVIADVQRAMFPGGRDDG